MDKTQPFPDSILPIRVLPMSPVYIVDLQFHLTAAKSCVRSNLKENRKEPLQSLGSFGHWLWL